MTIGESIKRLLEAGNKVILPGFGHLKKVEVAQSSSPSGKHLDPPGTKIRFNSSFSKDDGLLAKSWSQDGQVNEEEAHQRVLELVDAIRFALDKGEEYEMAGAGKFRRDDDGKIHFTPEQGWVLHPDQFGLDALEMEELEEEKKEDTTAAAGIGPGASSPGTKEAAPAKVPEKKPEAEEKPERTRTRQFGPAVERGGASESAKKPAQKPTRKPPARKPAPPPRVKKAKKDKPHRKTRFWRVIWIVAALLVAVLGVLLFVPAEKLPFLSNDFFMPDSLEQSAASDGTETMSIGEEEGADEGQGAEGPSTEDPGALSPADQTIPAEDPVQTAVEEPVELPVQEIQDRYFLIAGSFSSVVNASDLQDKLKAEGYDAQVISTDSRLYRVSVAAFSDKGEAERELRRLKQEPGLDAIWLLVNE